MRYFLERLLYIQDKTYANFLLEIRNLTSKLNIISESANLALREWKEALGKEISFEEYKHVEEEFIRNGHSLEKIYDTCLETVSALMNTIVANVN